MPMRNKGKAQPRSNPNTDKELWIQNRSRLDYGVSECGLTIKALTTINLYAHNPDCTEEHVRLALARGGSLEIGIRKGYLQQVNRKVDIRPALLNQIKASKGSIQAVRTKTSFIIDQGQLDLGEGGAEQFDFADYGIVDVPIVKRGPEAKDANVDPKLMGVVGIKDSAAKGVEAVEKKEPEPYKPPDDIVAIMPSKAKIGLVSGRPQWRNIDGVEMVVSDEAVEEKKIDSGVDVLSIAPTSTPTPTIEIMAPREQETAIIEPAVSEAGNVIVAPYEGLSEEMKEKVLTMEHKPRVMVFEFSGDVVGSKDVGGKDVGGNGQCCGG